MQKTLLGILMVLYLQLGTHPCTTKCGTKSAAAASLILAQTSNLFTHIFKLAEGVFEKYPILSSCV